MKQILTLSIFKKALKIIMHISLNFKSLIKYLTNELLQCTILSKCISHNKVL